MLKTPHIYQPELCTNLTGGKFGLQKAKKTPHQAGFL